jgi:hypothetical protein
MGRYRFSVFFSVFLKVGSVFGVGFPKYRDIGIGFSVFLVSFLNLQSDNRWRYVRAVRSVL